jgi:hypothetical protein
MMRKSGKSLMAFPLSEQEGKLRRAGELLFPCLFISGQRVYSWIVSLK